MKPTPEQYSAYLSHQPVAGVTVAHGTQVRIAGGAHAGEVGEVSSLAELGDDPRLLVQLESGIEAVVAQSQLESAAR
ncbi:hypothetical protein [Coralloluteibacterium stylophorae]|uniref:KOW domain-containing protein n=1 Tax=Coralloluteibacterium stylophorae TaxID=1776034 RepID=A0A8J8B0C6_9GAMM|nr:hypothetical protein [Coralloluteibacterium stylophorae]MBS7457235.1 hypothetical protein [Coralloluteibacterium stylophorae]